MASRATVVWMDGEYVPWSEARVHVSTDTVLRGANVFEGLRGYASPDGRQVYVFRLREHLERLWLSMKVLRMSLRHSRAELAGACTGIVARNGFREDVHIRPTAYFGEGPLNAYRPEEIATGAFVLAHPRASALSDSAGIACCVSAWRRIGDNVLPPRVKAGGNYLQSRYAAVQAVVDGYKSAILLNDRDKVAEGPGACVLLVREGRVIAPPVTAGILESITRATIAEFCRSDLGLEFVEREVDRTELYVAEEAFFCGSAWEITPVTSVDRYPVG
ncbi:MAG: aminotransferase class IV, partial [Candidatus Methylomirabilales bacterium]